ncbi:general odorant-binding protein lush-like [Pseudomyrmex gracilis]|uniref:general odorant-binding protein lush-like n=1 Tax=Pseudomyrmex gracilis TaxID=219809 RepID=UPI0009956960|nr:general odorant-binding protein lush-like [Pseudomyrmex gracilis]
MNACGTRFARVSPSCNPGSEEEPEFRNSKTKMRDISAILLVSFVFVANFRNADSRRMSLSEVKEALQPIRKLCIDKVKTDPKLIDDANNGKFVPDRKLQCYYKCLMLNTKSISKDDKVVEKALVKTAELMLEDSLKQPMLDGIEHCHSIAIKPLEGCELAYEMAKCFYEYNPAIAFYP